MKRSMLLFLIAISCLCPAWAISEDEILKQADGRIAKYRTGDVTLTLVGPDGAAVENGVTVRIEQTRHAFLFGCNIFKLGTCGSPRPTPPMRSTMPPCSTMRRCPSTGGDTSSTQGKPEYDKTR